MADDFVLEELAHLEQIFYDAGYKDGFAHGRIHGLIEGRALGREKGFEIWEELGFYEAFAKLWETIYLQQSRKNDRALHHIRHILELIAQFPLVNPSASDDASGLDIPKLFRQIRSRYKALCSTLGVRPSLRYSEGGSSQVHEESIESHTVESSGPKPASIWPLNNGTQQQLNGQGLNF